jgi:osmotically-inducible protein OsmY
MANNNRNQYNQDWDQNRRRFDKERYYNQHNEYNQNRKGTEDYGNDRNYGNASYGNQYGQQNDWNQDRYRNQDAGNYGTGYNAGYAGGWNENRNEDDQRWRNTNAGNNSAYNDRNYGNRNGNYNEANRGNRDWWDRTRDEVSSWFGDDDAERRRHADRKMMGAHRGKGPKGYTRSDDRIREDVHDRLADDSYVDASDIEVKVENGDVVLTGNVTDREQKRRAEDLIESLSGVRNVENRIHVRHEESRYADVDRKRGNYNDYTGTSSEMGNIGKESGTTNEIIRDTGNMNTKR